MTELKKILKSIHDLNWASNYLEYIQLRERGLKKQAQTELNRFFIDFSVQDENNRRTFIDLICKVAFITNESNVYCPYNLYHNVFLPEINNWIKEEPLNPVPYKWSNDFENNKKALELDPKDQIAIENYSNRLIGKISMNQHEIRYGYGYDGNPDDDILLINFLQPIVKNFEDMNAQKKIIETLDELRKCAINYKVSE